MIAIAAPLGDLFDSMLKRDAGVKDTGRLLGGHGGMDFIMIYRLLQCGYSVFRIS